MKFYGILKMSVRSNFIVSTVGEIDLVKKAVGWVGGWYVYLFSYCLLLGQREVHSV